MKLPESKRPELTASNPDPSVFRQSAPHPGEALVLDEDVQAQTLISPLRSRNITFRDGRGRFSRYRRVSILDASQLFDTTEDKPLLDWCQSNGFALLSANYNDFIPLSWKHKHCGVFVYRPRSLPITQTQNFVDAIEKIYNQYTKPQMQNELFALTTTSQSSQVGLGNPSQWIP